MFSPSRLSGPFFHQNRDLLRREYSFISPRRSLSRCLSASVPVLRRLHPWSWVELLGLWAAGKTLKDDSDSERLEKRLAKLVTKDFLPWRIQGNTLRGRRQLEIETQDSNRRTKKHTAPWTACLCIKIFKRDNRPTLVQAAAQTSGSSSRPSAVGKGSLLALSEGRRARGDWPSEPTPPAPSPGKQLEADEGREAWDWLGAGQGGVRPRGWSLYLSRWVRKRSQEESSRRLGTLSLSPSLPFVIQGYFLFLSSVTRPLKVS